MPDFRIAGRLPANVLEPEAGQVGEGAVHPFDPPVAVGDDDGVRRRLERRRLQLDPLELLGLQEREGRLVGDPRDRHDSAAAERLRPPGVAGEDSENAVADDERHRERGAETATPPRPPSTARSARPRGHRRRRASRSGPPLPTAHAPPGIRPSGRSSPSRTRRPRPRRPAARSGRRATFRPIQTAGKSKRLADARADPREDRVEPLAPEEAPLRLVLEPHDLLVALAVAVTSRLVMTSPSGSPVPVPHEGHDGVDPEPPPALRPEAVGEGGRARRAAPSARASPGTARRPPGG